jgi:hypothetical protein
MLSAAGCVCPSSMSHLKEEDAPFPFFTPIIDQLKSATVVRLTLEEKKALRVIEFTYAQQGIMTSGNEIIRIGMNFILKDFQKNGENSILAKVLKRLNF